MIVDNDHERIGKWMESQGAGYWRPGVKCIGLERDGNLIAATMYDCFNGASVYVHIAVKGYISKEFLWFIFYYAFTQLKVNVIIGLVPSNNLKARQFDEHLGFKLTAVISNGDPQGDTLIYTMYKHQCRWLRIKKDGFRSSKILETS